MRRKPDFLYHHPSTWTMDLPQDHKQIIMGQYFQIIFHICYFSMKENKGILHDQRYQGLTHINHRVTNRPESPSSYFCGQFSSVQQFSSAVLFVILYRQPTRSEVTRGGSANCTMLTNWDHILTMFWQC